MSTDKTPAPIDARSFAAGQGFITAVKVYWHTELFGAVRDEYQRRVEREPAPPQTVADVERLIGQSTTYLYFSWFERHMQRLKYSGRYGLLPWHRQERARLEARLAALPARSRRARARSCDASLLRKL